MSQTQNDTTTILTTIRNMEATEGAEYQALDWIYTFGKDGVPEDIVEQVLFIRLAESVRDARAFVYMHSDDLGFALTLPRYVQGLEVCAATVPEAFLHCAERIAEQFGRFLRPDIVEHFAGEGHKARVEAGRQAMSDVFRKAAPHITAISGCWSMAHLRLLPQDALIGIAERIPMSPFGVTFVTHVLLRMAQTHRAAQKLLARVVDAITNAPMGPEANAAVLYRFAIMAGVRVNVVGMPEWERSNRTGQVPKAWFNNVLRDAVVRSGWRFVVPTYLGFDRKVQREIFRAVVECGGDTCYCYVHNTGCWRKEKIAERSTQDEVLLPAIPTPDMPREGTGKYASIVIGFHPVALPTLEMIRAV